MAPRPLSTGISLRTVVETVFPVQQARFMEGSRRPRGSTTHLPDILHRLPVIEDARATDPRRFVCGILSIIARRETSVIGVDFTLSVAEVYAKATYASMRFRRTHTILQGVRVGSPRKGLPSWTLDFSMGSCVRGVKV